MRRITVISALVLAMPAMLACGLINSVTNTVAGGGNYKQAAAMWSDVPQMDGLTPNQAADLPAGVKLIMQLVLGNLGKLNPSGQDQSTGSIDWLAFNSTGTPNDVQNFYTTDRMTSAGWDQTDSSGCQNTSSGGTGQGDVFCVFGKQANGLQTYVAIIATQDANTQQTSVFFLRLQGAAATPTP